jgi:putative transposase
MFLAGVSTHSLAMISERLIGRHLSHTEISSANKELFEAVESWRQRDSGAWFYLRYGQRLFGF